MEQEHGTGRAGIFTVFTCSAQPASYYLLCICSKSGINGHFFFVSMLQHCHFVCIPMVEGMFAPRNSSSITEPPSKKYNISLLFFHPHSHIGRIIGMFHICLPCMVTSNIAYILLVGKHVPSNTAPFRMSASTWYLCFFITHVTDIGG